ncbi:PorV/PorQ family protein [Aliifodinibius halophilus]|uniref:PorV/PorQ family protein n=2 Tax=Fodinibius halophilus TaxID=1736908 RepID=A0A6M1SSQ7_9BACT|nr:PorV/PorQ family protein [Fodinibius halophilus]
MLLTAITGILILLSPIHSSAQNTGLDLLTIGPSARALSLNGAVTAEQLGASNLYTNPANLALENSSSLNAAYTLWIGDLNHTHAAINFKKGNRGFAFGFIGAQDDDIVLRTKAGPPEGSFAISLLSLSAGYAYQLGPIAIGGSLQYLREEYYIHNASGYTTNFGAATQLWDKRLQLGMSLLNLGKMDELINQSTSLPTNLQAGFNAELLTFTAPENKNLPITVSLKNNWVVPVKTTNTSSQGEAEREPYTNIAVEFDIAETILLHSGYKTGDTVRHWTAGAGVKVGSIVANYALIPFETGFGTVHSLGVSYQF